MLEAGPDPPIEKLKSLDYALVASRDIASRPKRLWQLDFASGALRPRIEGQFVRVFGLL